MASETIPINYHAMATSQAWHGNAVQQFKHKFNPWKDDDLSRMQLMRFNVLRQVHLRDADMRSLYWRRLDIEDQLIAEAEHAAYAELYSQLFEAECEYVRDKYLADEIAFLDLLIDSPKAFKSFLGIIESAVELEQRAFKSFASNDASVSDAELSRKTLRIGLPAHLIPTTYIENAAFHHALVAPNVEQVGTILPLPMTPAEKKQVNRWRNDIAQIQVDLDSSSSILVREFALAGHKHSKLKPPYGLTHVLLENEFVPDPSLSTFAAWFSICGIAFRRVQLDEQAAWTRLCGYPPTPECSLVAGRAGS